MAAAAIALPHFILRSSTPAKAGAQLERQM